MSSTNSSIVEPDKNGQFDLTVSDKGNAKIKRLRAQMDQVMADLATAESNYAPIKRKRDPEDKDTNLAHTDLSKISHATKKASDPSKTVCFPPTTNYR